MRCPPAKHVTDDTANSKCRKRFTMESPCCTIHRFIWMVNGQCLYATRRIHFGHRRWKKNKKICTFVSDAISIFLTSGKKCRNYQKVYSSDDGISLPLFMVPNLCIDKKLGFDSPRCAVSFPRIGIGQMDSKQEFFAPSDVQVCLHTRYDQGCSPAVCAKVRARSFQ